MHNPKYNLSFFQAAAVSSEVWFGGPATGGYGGRRAEGQGGPDVGGHENDQAQPLHL